jgi:hypothetical protein
MRPLLFFITTILLTTAPLHAATTKMDSLTVGSRTYRDVTVLGLNATDLYISHSEGMANVKLKHLDADLQRRLGYNPAAAEEAEKQRTIVDSQYLSALASNLSAQPNAPGELHQANPFADPITESSMLGKSAPPVSQLNWNPPLPDISRKYLLVVFHAPWSPASRQAVSALAALQQRHTDKLVLLNVQMANRPSGQEPSAFPAAPTVQDPEARLAVSWGITSVPSVVLIDSAGKVLYHGHPAALDERKIFQNAPGNP